MENNNESSQEVRDYISGILMFYDKIDFKAKENANISEDQLIAGWDKLSQYEHEIKEIVDPIVACRGIIDMSQLSVMPSKESYCFEFPKEGCVEYIVKHLSDHFIWDRDDSATRLYINGVNLWEVYDVLYKNATVFNRLYSYHFDSIRGPKMNFRFKKVLDGAVAPRKNKVSDSGYDLVLVQKIKQVGNVSFYDTGIQVQPPLGYYFDLVGRSSISKSGYMVANSVGIIDQSYRGNVIVALVKIDDNAEELQLPNRLVQLIPRKVIHMEPFDVEDKDLGDTKRGDGGFGSSG